MDTLQFDDSTTGLLGEGAQAISRPRLFLVIAAGCAIAYPWLLWLFSAAASLLHVSTPLTSGAIAIGVAMALAAAWSVMLVCFRLELALGKSGNASPDRRRAQTIIHLAFAAPSMLVGFGNIAGVLHARTAVPVVWPIFWLLIAGASLIMPKKSTPTPMSPKAQRRLSIAHGISACAIIVLFIAPHIGNHLAGFWNGATHIMTMTAVRQVYRSEIVEPVLLTLILFQIVSGVVLVRDRIRHRSGMFETLQTMTGVYVGVYFLAHMTAVFAARYAGTDTNWNWLTGNGHGMLTSLSSIPLVAHYWVGPVAIFSHVACGLRQAMLQKSVSALMADRFARTLIGLGALASSVILVALLGIAIA